MGYYTNYDLAVINKDDSKVKAFKEDLRKESSDADGNVDGDLEDLLNDGYIYAKLYDLEDLISKVAPRHPDVLIILEGDGEDSDDLWEARWKGDNYERHDAVIPPFTNPNLQFPD